MKIILFIVCTGIFFFAVSEVNAVDKVVVIPLNSSEQKETGWVNLNPSSARLSQGATFAIQSGPVAGIDLPNENSPSFGLGFTVPRDFIKGSDLIVHMIWNISESSCSISFQPMALSVARPGRPHLTGGSVIAGLSIIGGTKLNAPDIENQPDKTLISIKSPESETDIEGGDSVIFGLMRWPWHPEDTCDGASMKIHGLSVNYQRE